MIGTAALIIVLSVFNGFEDLIIRLYNSFDPDLKIELTAGKSFDSKIIKMEELKKIDGVKFVNFVLEESALAKFQDRQYIIRLKGVSEGFERITGLDTMIVDGTFKLQGGDTNFAVIGGGVAYNLGINLSNVFGQIEIYAPRRNDFSLANPAEAFNRRYISPSGVFTVQQEFDSKYIIVPIRFAREIFEYGDRITCAEIDIDDDKDSDEIAAAVSELIGNNFIIKNRYQQHQLLYRIMKSEKWAVFLILTFILIIAVFNVISSLTMLIIEKKKDIAIFKSLGAESSFLRRVFLTEGMFITFSGAIAGLLIGFIVCYAQEQYGIIQLSGSGSFIIDAYPIKLVAKDFLYVFLTVSLIGLLAAWYPAKKLIREEINLKAIAGEK